MTRAEHLAWAKERALEYLPDIQGATASFISDLRKHDDLSDHPVIELLGMHLMAGLLTLDNCRSLVTGTN